MSNPVPSRLPDLRRIVTSHNSRGVAVVQTDSLLSSQDMETVKGARGSTIWITTDSIPTNDNNSRNDGGERKIEDPENFHLVHPDGTNLRSTELAPGAITPMHRTSSLDYNILVSGELILITEDGKEKHLKNPGDTVIQKGTMHAWRNPSKQWTRWISVLISAEPAVVNGEYMKPEFLQ